MVLTPLPFVVLTPLPFDSNRVRFNLGQVHCVDQAEAGISFWQTVDRLAKRDRWDIIHYAGHSCYQGPTRGVFFFPGRFVETVSVETFSRELGRPRFVYLSSCHGSQASFVFELAEQKVASILGFRWDIDDGMAVEHAKAFYTALFEEERSLEYAFLKARQRMHDLARDNRIWAAPMLMM
jgi:hypothetical protein